MGNAYYPESNYHSYPLDESEGDIFSCARRAMKDVDALTVRTGGPVVNRECLEFAISEPGRGYEEDLISSTILDRERVRQLRDSLTAWLGEDEDVDEEPTPEEAAAAAQRVAAEDEAYRQAVGGAQ